MKKRNSVGIWPIFSARFGYIILVDIIVWIADCSKRTFYFWTAWYFTATGGWRLICSALPVRSAIAATHLSTPEVGNGPSLGEYYAVIQPAQCWWATTCGCRDDHVGLRVKWERKNMLWKICRYLNLESFVFKKTQLESMRCLIESQCGLLSIRQNLNPNYIFRTPINIFMTPIDIQDTY